jgi:hypothetical protein
MTIKQCVNMIGLGVGLALIRLAVIAAPGDSGWSTLPVVLMGSIMVGIFLFESYRGDRP